MKKVFTLFLPVLGFLVSGSISAQGQNTSKLSCEVSDVPAAASNPAVQGKTKVEPYSMALLFDNGPLVNFAGQGFGGHDVSSLHDGLTMGFYY